MKISEEVTNKLDKSKVYCQKCILEGKIIPLDYPEDDSEYIRTNCGHTGRNCNTLRYHKNEWHLFYGYNVNAYCRTCQALSNLKNMNDPNNEEIQKNKRKWYDSQECKTMLKQNADHWRASEEGKAHAIKNCEHYRNSKHFKKHSTDGLKEYLKTEEFQIHIKKHNKENCDKLNSRENYYCPDCNKITIHNGFGTCLVCHPLTGGNGGIASKEWRIFEFDNIFCNENCNIYNNCSNKNQLKNKWGYCEKAVGLTGGHPTYLIEKDPKCSLHKDCKTMFYNDIKKEYICWKCFKEENIILDQSNINIILNEIKKIYSNSYIQYTYRKQNSIDWNMARQAFEQDLLDHNIDYFAYIKFYINKNNESIPLVRGKSGSKNVNINGSDVNFSENINDGPARRFLKEENLLWNKTKILVIPASSESEAYAIENWLSKYCPFES